MIETRIRPALRPPLRDLRISLSIRSLHVVQPLVRVESGWNTGLSSPLPTETVAVGSEIRNPNSFGGGSLRSEFGFPYSKQITRMGEPALTRNDATTDVQHSCLQRRLN